MDSNYSGTTSPDVVREAVANSLAAELTTVRADRPATVPLTPLYDHQKDVVIATAATAFAGKAERAAANPKVGLLLHGSDGPVYLTGTATVRDDDFEANSARIEQLIEGEPSSRKQDVLHETAEFLETRLGMLLLDWYGLRILIEVDPVSVVPVAPPTTADVGACPAANIDDAEAAAYDRAVVSVVGDDGWPRTWQLDRTAFDDGTLRLSSPAEVTLTKGQPACLLCHGFSRDLRDITQRVVRGRVRKRRDGFVFDPASSFRLRNETPLDFVRFVINGKRRTRRYFRQRGETYRGVPALKTLLRLGDESDVE